MEGLNLLPWREQRKEELKQQFIMLLIGAFIAGLLVVIFIHMYFSEKIHRQTAVNSYLRAEMSSLDGQIIQIKDLKSHKDEMLKRLSLIYKLQESRPLIVNAFDTLVKIIPPGLYLRSFKREGDNITLEGNAESNAPVSQLMINAEASPWFTDAKLQQIKTDTTDSDYPRSFILSLMLTGDKNKTTTDGVNAN